MSRAFRIRVRESLHKVLRAEDHVSTTLELLPILPREQLAGLLAQQLAQWGFDLVDGAAIRQRDGAEVRIDLRTATVTVRSTVEQEIDETLERDGFADADVPETHKHVERRLRHDVQQTLERRVEQHQASLQSAVTDQLERQLADVRKELDQAVNRVTAEALEIRAAQLGTIKHLTEDAAAGSMTIVVEV